MRIIIVKYHHKDFAFYLKSLSFDENQDTLI